MTEQVTEPAGSLSALMQAIRAANQTDDAASRRGAYRFGETCASSDLTIEETFELLEQEAGETLHDLHAELLGSIVRGYVDQVARSRALTRRKGTGRLSSHVSRLAALHRINRAATASLRLEDVLSTVVEVVAETIDGDACSVFLYDASSRLLILRATVGLNPAAVGRVAIRSDAGITGTAASTRQTAVAVDARQHPAYFTDPIVEEDAYTSQVSVPLILREPERLVGVMNIQSAERREFDADEITFLETAGGELAIAIENARLYSQTDAELRRRIDELHTLRTIARSMASTLHSDELYPLIASQASSVAHGVRAAVYRVRDPHGAMRVHEQSVFPERATDSGFAFPSDFIETICRSFSALVSGTSSDEGGGSFIIGAPLMTGHGILGAVCVEVDGRENHGDEKLGLFQAFADSAALAVENAELFDEARRGYSRASTLLQEMHHRVRNNLQTVAALLSMQARHVTSDEAREPLQEAVARVQSIAAVHNLLSGDNVTSTSIVSVIRHVVEEASVNAVPPGSNISFNIEPSLVEASSRQATILALIVNECVTNAVEHGMAGTDRGEITIMTDERDGIIEVVVENSGNALPEDFDLSRDRGLGLRIASTLATSDLAGSFGLEPREGGGARAIIRFPA